MKVHHETVEKTVSTNGALRRWASSIVLTVCLTIPATLATFGVAQAGSVGNSVGLKCSREEGATEASCQDCVTNSCPQNAAYKQCVEGGFQNCMTLPATDP